MVCTKYKRADRYRTSCTTGCIGGWTPGQPKCNVCTMIWYCCIKTYFIHFYTVLPLLSGQSPFPRQATTHNLQPFISQRMHAVNMVIPPPPLVKRPPLFRGQWLHLEEWMSPITPLLATVPFILPIWSPFRSKLVQFSVTFLCHHCHDGEM